MQRVCDTSEGFFHASTVKLPRASTLRLGLAGTRTSSFVVVYRNASPTSPGPKLMEPCKMPLLVPMMSLALPSPGHQLTIPEGAGSQEVGELTVSVALALVEPYALVIVISYVP